TTPSRHHHLGTPETRQPRANRPSGSHTREPVNHPGGRHSRRFRSTATTSYPFPSRQSGSNCYPSHRAKSPPAEWQTVSFAGISGCRGHRRRAPFPKSKPALPVLFGKVGKTGYLLGFPLQGDCTFTKSKATFPKSSAHPSEPAPAERSGR